MSTFRITEYDPQHAESIARMWNLSSENWGGYDTVLTAKDIIDEHQNSDDLKVFLALDGEEVIGYCSFSEYKEDEKALYIPVLNVRPDYHGKKVGKALVLQAVELASAMKWPRLDLYTWPGNTKAVPLYKKCGFFWEKRDDSTHLMNFIPSVRQIEAVQEYFAFFDWYRDSTREIAVIPDGQPGDDYSYYTYLWEREGQQLKMEFERRGRGLRLIETTDYLVSVSLEDHQLAFGKEYAVSYRLVNKSGKELNIVIEGKDDKNIKFPFSKKITVKDEMIVKGKFYLGEITEKQNPGRTHPVVAAELLINGKKALFQVGVETKFPVQLALEMPPGELLKGVESCCYLNLENGFNQPVVIDFTLPVSKEIDFLKKDIQLELKAREKRSLNLPIMLKEYHFLDLSPEIRIKGTTETIHFQARLTTPLKGRNAAFAGEREEEWVICNGNYQVTLSKFNNEIKVSNSRQAQVETFFLHPRFGLPYTTEFAKKRPEKVDFFQEGKQMVMKATYRSKEFVELSFVSVIVLHADGLLENYYEIYNDSEHTTQNEIYIGQSIFNQLSDAILPFGDGIVFSRSTEADEPESWDLNCLSENWIFQQDPDGSRGLAWPAGSKLKSHEWYLSVETKVGKINGHSEARSGSVYIAFDLYHNWSDFRYFATGKGQANELPERMALDFEVNGRNPFVREEFKIKLTGYRKSVFNGRLFLSAGNNSFLPLQEEFQPEDRIKQQEISVQLSETSQLDQINLTVDFESFSERKEKIFFPLARQEIVKEILNEQGLKSYHVDNGQISFRVAPDFSAALYSLKYKEREWLDSSFPRPTAKSWWSPWLGGINCLPKGLRNSSMQEAARTVDFVEISDNFNNRWQGLRVKVKIEQHKEFKGLGINQYFLVLPGIPLLLHLIEVEQQMGYYLKSRPFFSEIFLKPAGDLQKSWFEHRPDVERILKYKAGRIGYQIRAERSLVFGSDCRQERIQIYQSGADPLWGISNVDIIGCMVKNTISAEDGSRRFLPATFFIFTEQGLSELLLEDLKGVSFKGGAQIWI